MEDTEHGAGSITGAQPNPQLPSSRGTCLHPALLLIQVQQARREKLLGTRAPQGTAVSHGWEPWERPPATQSCQHRARGDTEAGGGDGTQLPGMEHRLPQGHLVKSTRQARNRRAASRPLWS